MASSSSASVADLANQIKQLQLQVKSMKPQRGRSQSRGRRGPSGARQPARNQSRRRRSRSRGYAGTSSAEGSEARITGQEKLFEVVTDATGVFRGSVPISPTESKAAFGRLKALGELFDQMSWVKCVLKWHPSVGTTVGGDVCVGVDWDSKAPDTIDDSHVLACTPNFVTAVFKEHSMHVNLMKYQDKRWIRLHNGKPVATVLLSVSGPKSQRMGFITMEYTVRFMGGRLT